MAIFCLNINNINIAYLHNFFANNIVTTKLNWKSAFIKKKNNVILVTFILTWSYSQDRVYSRKELGPNLQLPPACCSRYILPLSMEPTDALELFTLHALYLSLLQNCGISEMADLANSIVFPLRRPWGSFGCHSIWALVECMDKEILHCLWHPKFMSVCRRSVVTVSSHSLLRHP